MAELVFQCPGCGAALVIDDQAAGLYIGCPHCPAVLRVPSANGQPAELLVPAQQGQAAQAALREENQRLAARLEELTAAAAVPARREPGPRPAEQRLQRELAEVRQRLQVVLSASADQKNRLDQFEKDRAHWDQALREAARRADELGRENADLRRKLEAFSLPAEGPSARLVQLEARGQEAERLRAEAERRVQVLQRENETLRKRYELLASALRQRP